MTGTADKADMRFLLVMLWALWCPVAMWLFAATARSIETANELILDPEGQKYAVMCYCIGIISALACDGSLAKQQGRPKRVIVSYVVVALVSPLAILAGTMAGFVVGASVGSPTGPSLVAGFILGLVPFLLPWLLWNTLPNPGRSKF